MQRIECDVLVIGGGMAGCWAALEAKEMAPEVVLVEKGRVSRCGKSSFAGAGILCPDPSDDLDAWHRDIVERGRYLNDQEWLKTLLEEQPERISEMERWGVPFEKDKHGKILRQPTLGSAVGKSAIMSSLKTMEVFKRRLEKSGVKLLERVMIVGLLSSDGVYPTEGSIVGALGFHTRTGETYLINSNATVLATGGFGYADLCGDGVAQAFRAGAEVSNMEFLNTFDNMGLGDKYRGLHLGTFQRIGFKLWNSRGERFMERYYPLLKEKVNRHDLALAVIIEEMEGRGPVYMDLTYLKEEEFQKLRNQPATANRIGALEEIGIDISKQKVKMWVSSGFLNHTNMGGIRHNLHGESNLEGLFVAGEAGGYPPRGCGSMGPLAICCVTGYRAGRYAAQYALEKPRKAESPGQVKSLESEAFTPLKREKGMSPQELLEQMLSFLAPARVSIFRNRGNVTGTLKEIESWKEKASHLVARDYHELIKAQKLSNYIECAELLFRASLEREESRGIFIRTEYPYRDDLNWLKWIVLRKNEKGVHIKAVTLPIYRYPVRPEKYEKVPLPLPLPKLL